MLLAVLLETMMSTDRAAEFVEVVLALRRPFRLLASTVPSVKAFDELTVRLVPALTFSVLLGSLLLAFSVVHCDLAV